MGTDKLDQIHEMIIEEPQIAKGTALGFTWVPMEEDIPDIYLKLPLSWKTSTIRINSFNTQQPSKLEDIYNQPQNNTFHL